MSCDLVVTIFGFAFLALQSNHNTAMIKAQIEATRSDIRLQTARLDDAMRNNGQRAATPTGTRREEER